MAIAVPFRLILGHPMTKICVNFSLRKGEVIPPDVLERLSNGPSGGGAKIQGKLRFGGNVERHRKVLMSLDSLCALGFSMNNTYPVVQRQGGGNEQWRIVTWWDRNHPGQGLNFWGETAKYVQSLFARKWNVANVFDNTPAEQPHSCMWSFNLSQPMSADVAVAHVLEVQWSQKAKEMLSDGK